MFAKQQVFNWGGVHCKRDLTCPEWFFKLFKRYLCCHLIHHTDAVTWFTTQSLSLGSLHSAVTQFTTQCCHLVHHTDAVNWFTTQMLSLGSLHSHCHSVHYTVLSLGSLHSAVTRFTTKCCHSVHYTVLSLGSLHRAVTWFTTQCCHLVHFTVSQFTTQCCHLVHYTVLSLGSLHNHLVHCTVSWSMQSYSHQTWGLKRLSPVPGHGTQNLVVYLET